MLVAGAVCLGVHRARIPCMDIEKTMQFILETQAKHETAIQQSDERFARFREQTEERFRGLVDVSMSLAANLQALGEETNRRFQETGQLIRELREIQAGTDYKLNALIDTVDKLIKHNGSR